MKVAITGASGTIGSAFVSHYADKGDIVYAIDTHENGLYHLKGCIPILQDIGDAGFWTAFYDRNDIDLVINCAAAKQLPIVEQHPFYAFKTNALGVLALLGGPRVVHISTDKAVYPTSLYGFTKYIGEEFAKAAGATVVRLVNVWASSGSVAEVFAAQINAGGPVTVTDPHMTRYFMQLEDAVDIITSVDKPGVYMPSVYDTVNIWDLAQRMTSDLETPIQITGARPGEKIIEDLRYTDEKVSQYANGIDCVFSPLRIDIDKFLEESSIMDGYIKYNALKLMWKWVPEK